MTRTLPKLPPKTTLETENISIRTLLDYLEEGDTLEINNKYQRGEVGSYKPQFRTRLMESVIRGFPIPAILVMRKKDKSDEIIDGQQRLTTIKSFIDGNFSLEGHHLLRLDKKAYDKITFNELDADHKNRVKRDYKMLVHYIDDSMPDWMVYILINAGQNPLTAAELRKAWLSEFEGYWRIDTFATSGTWTRYWTPSALKRERGTEMFCRGLVSMKYGDQSSNQSSKKYLESHLKSYLDAHNTQQVEADLKQYEKVLTLAREILGDQPFRTHNLITGKKQKASKTMLEPISYVFSKLLQKYSQNKIIKKQTELVSVWDEHYTYLSDGSPRPTGGWTPTKFVKYNLDLESKMMAVMKGTLPNRGSESRIPDSMREQVENAHRKPDGTIDCGICNNQLKDEITMDHIVSVEDGGETTLENLQPAHRSCNSSKGKISVIVGQITNS
jgi:hypothetical protein